MAVSAVSSVSEEDALASFWSLKTTFSLFLIVISGLCLSVAVLFLYVALSSQSRLEESYQASAVVDSAVANAKERVLSVQRVLAQLERTHHSLQLQNAEIFHQVDVVHALSGFYRKDIVLREQLISADRPDSYSDSLLVELKDEERSVLEKMEVLEYYNAVRQRQLSAAAFRRAQTYLHLQQ